MIGQRKEKTLSPNATRNALVILAFIFVVGIGLRFYQSQSVDEYTTALFVINSGTITAEIADTSEKRELGLGDRESLEARHGMYFPFPVARKWLFWMKGMHFPIDAVWIHDGIVVDITRNAQPPTEDQIERFSPMEKSDAVLEINAGEADELNIRIGDVIRVHY